MSENQHSSSAVSFLYYGIAVLFLSIYAFLAITSIRIKSPTYDEPIHIAGGCLALGEGDYRIDPENGLLPNIWSAIPALYLFKVKMPDRKGEMWRVHDRWRMAQGMMFRNYSDTDAMFFVSRLMMIAVGVLSGIVVFCVSRVFWGRFAALISLFLYVLSPTVMAHSRLATSDMFLSLFLLLSTAAFHRLLNRLTLKNFFLFIGALSCLALCKMSSLLIVPVLIVIFIMHLLLKSRWYIRVPGFKVILRRLRTRIAVCIVLLILAGVSVLAVIWGAYGFRYSMLSDDKGRAGLEVLWKQALKRNALPEKCISVLRETHILPEAYLYGLAYVRYHSCSRESFLNGNYSSVGWWYYFPLCVIYKTPLSVILLFLIACTVLFIRSFYRFLPARSGISIIQNFRNKADTDLLWNMTLPLSIICIYFLFAVISGLNIGQRHLLPVYLPAFILTGGGILFLFRSLFPCRRIAIGFVIMLAGLLIFENIITYPNYLSYFSLVAGGRKAGYRHLVDSSVDWGQDLKQLKIWLEKERIPDENVYISYFGSVDLDRYGMMQKRLLCDLEQRSNSLFELRGGIYCISATMLQMVYFPELAHWSSLSEKKLRRYRKEFLRIYKIRGDYRRVSQLIQEKGRKNIESDLRGYEKYRFAKLAAALRKLKPDKMIAGSILIYKLSDKDLQILMPGESNGGEHCVE